MCPPLLWFLFSCTIGEVHKEVPGIPPLKSIYSSCEGQTWYRCPPSYGLPNGTAKFGDCCEGTSFCPGIANECTSAGSCCQTGFPLLCSTSEGTWCCTNEYPICGSGKRCLSGSGGNCDCGQCIAVNPCKFVGCTSCKQCCDLYIPAICNGPSACSGDNGPTSTRNIQAKMPCNQTLDQYNQNISTYMIAFSCAAYFVTDETPSQPDLGLFFDIKYKFVEGPYAAYIATDTTHNAIVFGFRGTTGLSQAIAEIIAELRKLDGYHWPNIPEVTTTMYFTIGVLKILSRAQAPLQQLMKQFPNYRVWFVGHSLGGSMASIAAFSLVNDGIVINPLVYTFGEARSGNSQFAFMYNGIIPNTFRVVLESDIVPHVPPCNLNSEPGCEITTSKFWGYHHNSEIWYHFKEDLICGYQSCLDFENRGEDPNCSDSLSPNFSFPDHFKYWDVLKVGWCGDFVVPGDGKFGLLNCDGAVG